MKTAALRIKNMPELPLQWYPPEEVDNLRIRAETHWMNTATPVVLGCFCAPGKQQLCSNEKRLDFFVKGIKKTYLKRYFVCRTCCCFFSVGDIHYQLSQHEKKKSTSSSDAPIEREKNDTCSYDAPIKHEKIEPEPTPPLTAKDQQATSAPSAQELMDNFKDTVQKLNNTYLELVDGAKAQEMAQLKKENATLKDENAQLLKGKEESASKIAQLANKTPLMKDVTLLEEEKKQLLKCNTLLVKEKIQLLKQKDESASKITQLIKDITLFNEEKTQLLKANTLLKEENVQLIKEKEESARKIAQLAKDSATFKEERTQLAKDVEQLLTENILLKDENIQLSKKKDDFVNEIAILTNNNTLLQDENMQLSKKTVTFAKSIEQLAKDHAQSKTKIVKLLEDNVKLSNGIKGLTAQINALEKENEDLRNDRKKILCILRD